MRPSMRRLLFLAAVAALVAAFFLFGLNDYLSLSFLKTSQAHFSRLYAEHPVAVIGSYFGIYVAVAALSLPGAAVLTLAGGALFGLWMGVAVVSFASTLGASLACLAARFLLRDMVANRFGGTLTKINAGIGREGAFYLFSLRLIPAFPFFAINLAMGLTDMPLFTFAWVSQLGMLPGTIVYVNAGRALGRLDSLSGILSPGLILSFALLGLFPLAAKKILERYRRSRGTQTPDRHG